MCVGNEQSSLGKKIFWNDELQNRGLYGVKALILNDFDYQMCPPMIMGSGESVKKLSHRVNFNR